LHEPGQAQFLTIDVLSIALFRSRYVAVDLLADARFVSSLTLVRDVRAPKADALDPAVVAHRQQALGAHQFQIPIAA
jgi:hypothetical protein